MDGLNLTASACDCGSVCQQSWSQYLLLCRNHCILYQLHPSLLAILGDCVVQSKNRGRSTDNPSGCHPIRTPGAPISIIPHFMPSALSATTLPIYPGLGQAPNTAGLHTLQSFWNIVWYLNIYWSGWLVFRSQYIPGSLRTFHITAVFRKYYVWHSINVVNCLLINWCLFVALLFEFY